MAQERVAQDEVGKPKPQAEVEEVPDEPGDGQPKDLETVKSDEEREDRFQATDN